MPDPKDATPLHQTVAPNYEPDDKGLVGVSGDVAAAAPTYPEVDEAPPAQAAAPSGSAASDI